MRTILVFFILSTQYCFAQQNNFKCSCSAIGLDNAWADSNKISCYQVPVNKDRSKPNSGSLKIAVVVAPAINTSKEAPLLYLHGGPGIATIENTPRYLKSKTWKKLRENRPLIFMDYRGTGSSEPQLCPDIADSLGKFYGAGASASNIKDTKISLYKKCREQLAADGIDIATFNSIQFASDADNIRKSLGIDSWNVYGVSFGTTVALNLLRDHGSSINSVILDSPFPPNAPWLDFIRPFDTSFKILEKNIAADPVTRSRFPNLRADYVNAVNRLNKEPAKIQFSAADIGMDFTGNDFAWSVWKALLNPKSIPFVPLAVREVAAGNDSVLSKWISTFKDPNSFGKFSEPQSFAVLCKEGRPKGTLDSKESLFKNYPDFTSFHMDFEGDLCDAWQPTSAAASFYKPVVSSKPVLILSGEYDPVCPPLFGELTARTLKNATFINVPSASHAVIHADDCVLNIAAGFLSNPGTKPNTACVQKRPPVNFILDDLSGALSRYK